MDQNVEHICHPPKAVQMEGVRENSWRLPANVELESESEIEPDFLKLSQPKIHLHGKV